MHAIGSAGSSASELAVALDKAVGSGAVVGLAAAPSPEASAARPCNTAAAGEQASFTDSSTSCSRQPVAALAVASQPAMPTPSDLLGASAAAGCAPSSCTADGAVTTANAGTPTGAAPDAAADMLTAQPEAQPEQLDAGGSVAVPTSTSTLEALDEAATPSQAQAWLASFGQAAEVPEPWYQLASCAAPTPGSGAGGSATDGNAVAHALAADSSSQTVLPSSPSAAASAAHAAELAPEAPAAVEEPMPADTAPAAAPNEAGQQVPERPALCTSTAGTEAGVQASLGAGGGDAASAAKWLAAQAGVTAAQQRHAPDRGDADGMPTGSAAGSAPDSDEGESPALMLPLLPQAAWAGLFGPSTQQGQLPAPASPDGALLAAELLPGTLQQLATGAAGSGSWPRSLQMEVLMAQAG